MKVHSFLLVALVVFNNVIAYFFLVRPMIFGTTENKDAESPEPSRSAKPPSNNIVGFYHLSALNNWTSVLEDQMKYISKGGLFDVTREFHIGLLGERISSRRETLQELVTSIMDKNKGPKAKKVIFHTAEMDGVTWERFTLMKMYHHCQSHPNDYIYYFHSKGTTTASHTTKYKLAKQWRDPMQEFLFVRWQEVVERLKDVDAVGVNFLCWPYNHFSGNFWWSTCSYLSRHHPPGEPSPTWGFGKVRYHDEGWILDVYPEERVKFVEMFYDESPRYSKYPSLVDFSTLYKTPSTPKSFQIPYTDNFVCDEERRAKLELTDQEIGNGLV